MLCWPSGFVLSHQPGLGQREAGHGRSHQLRGEGLVRTPICGFLVVQGEAMGSERQGRSG